MQLRQVMRDTKSARSGCWFQLLKNTYAELLLVRVAGIGAADSRSSGSDAEMHGSRGDWKLTISAPGFPFGSVTTEHETNLVSGI